MSARRYRRLAMAVQHKHISEADLERMLVLECLRFIKAHEGDVDVFDNDALMALFANTYTHLPYDTATHAYIFFWPNYAEVKDLMEKAGKREYEDFADGTRLLEGQTRDLEPFEFLVLLNI